MNRNARKLARLLHARQLRHADLAKRLRVKRETVTRWISGTHHPSVMLRFALATWSDGELDPRDWDRAA